MSYRTSGHAHVLYNQEHIGGKGFSGSITSVNNRTHTNNNNSKTSYQLQSQLRHLFRFSMIGFKIKLVPIVVHTFVEGFLDVAESKNPRPAEAEVQSVPFTPAGSSKRDSTRLESES